VDANVQQEIHQSIAEPSHDEKIADDAAMEALVGPAGEAPHEEIFSTPIPNRNPSPAASRGGI